MVNDIQASVPGNKLEMSDSGGERNRYFYKKTLEFQETMKVDIENISNI